MSDLRDAGARIRSPPVPILTAFREDESLGIDSNPKWVDWRLGGTGEICRLVW